MTINHDAVNEILSREGEPAAISYLINHENLSAEQAKEYFHSSPSIQAVETPALNKYYCEKCKFLFTGEVCPDCGCNAQKGECEIPLNTDEGITVKVPIIEQITEMMNGRSFNSTEDFDIELDKAIDIVRFSENHFKEKSDNSAASIQPEKKFDLRAFLNKLKPFK